MWPRRIFLTLTGLAVLYTASSAALYTAMLQDPDTFGAFMAKLPTVSMMILPFRPLWMSARAGHLQPGDLAPDFELPLVDHSRTVHLSTEFREKPVVLVFGSYT